MIRSVTAPLCCIALALVLNAGCGKSEDRWTKDRPRVIPVSGIVTMKGVPVDGANVSLTSANKGPAAFGITDSSGNFKLTTYGKDDGAAPGKYIVTVRKKVVETKPDPVSPDLNPAIIVKETFIVPEKFGHAHTSDLTVEVKDSPDNFLKIDIP